MVPSELAWEDKLVYGDVLSEYTRLVVLAPSELARVMNLQLLTKLGQRNAPLVEARVGVVVHMLDV